jgi:His/Glu/Gln/Arg/opine family amino acid ABC transporter permease subunit
MLARLRWADLFSTAAGVLIIAWLASVVRWDFVGSLDFSVVVEYRYPLLRGLGVTLGITSLALALGLVVGVVLAAALQLPLGPLRWVIIGYIELWRNTPLIVQLFWVHFALPIVTGISTTAFQSGFLALALQSSAYLADIARAGIQAVPRGQWEAARALGLPRSSLWLEVVLPQALKLVIPALANIALGFLNGSSLLALLHVGELMTAATKISDYAFKPIEVLTTAGLIYFVMGTALTQMTRRLELVARTPV